MVSTATDCRKGWRLYESVLPHYGSGHEGPGEIQECLAGLAEVRKGSGEHSRSSGSLKK